MRRGVLAVLHVADEHAVLDEGILCAGGALVIDGDGPAPVGKGAIIQNGHAPGCDLLAHQARKGRGFLAVEITLKPVTHGLVQQNTGPSRPEHHIHHPRGAGIASRFTQATRSASRATGFQ